MELTSVRTGLDYSQYDEQHPHHDDYDDDVDHDDDNDEHHQSLTGGDIHSTVEMGLPDIALDGPNSSANSSFDTTRNRRRCVLGTIVVGVILLIVVISQLSSSSDSDSGSGSGSGEALWTKARLPSNVVPSMYTLELSPDLSNFTFSGHVAIDVDISEATSWIILNAKELQVSSVSLEHIDNNNAVIGIDRFFLVEENEVLVIESAALISVGTSAVRVKIDFNGVLDDSLAGFYRSRYVTTAGEERYIATTQFESSDARKAYPCFDEPALKAVFQVSIVHDATMQASSNMPSISSQIHSPGKKITAFAPTPKMSTYLTCFIVHDFEYIEGTLANNIRVRVYTPSDEIDQAAFALNVSMNVIDYYPQFFGVAYPLPKLDMFAIPDFAAGAMENWGIVTYRQVDLLFDPVQSSAANRQRVAVVIAHELAHQWFGNIVTMKWWDDLWLNEGFAAFVEHIGTNHMFPEWHMWRQFLVDTQAPAMELDALSSSHPIHVDVKRPADIEAIFDAISYNKGASVLLMMRTLFPDGDTFKAGLKAYLEAHLYSNAKTSDLWQALSDALGQVDYDLATVMNSWTQQAGYPVVHVSRGSDGKLHAWQERFSLLVDAPASTLNGWYVPINVETPYTKTAKTVMGPVYNSPANMYTIDLSGPDNEWFKANIGRQGFYRVNYERNNWNRLITALAAGVFYVPDRVALIDDAFAFARSLHVDMEYDLPLELATTVLKTDTSYVVWRGALRHLSYIARHLESTDVYGHFHDYMLDLMKNVIDTSLQPANEFMLTRLKSMIATEAVRFNHPAMMATCWDKFRAFVTSNGADKVSAEYHGAVFNAGIALATPYEWDFLFEYYRTNATVSERRVILGALGGTRIGWIARKYLSYLLDSDYVRPQDSSYVLYSVGSNPLMTQVVWEFVQDHWSSLVTSGLFGVDRIIRNAVIGFDTEAELAQFDEFFSRPGIQSDRTERTVTQVREDIRARIQWRKTHIDKITDWLKQKGYGV
jgi:aminopeptidase N